MADDEFSRAVELEEDGDALEALQMYSKAYCDSLSVIDSRSVREDPDVVRDASFVRAGYFYVWFLFDFREDGDGERELAQLDRVANHYDPHTAPAPMLLAMAQIENLKSRRAADLNLPDVEHLRDAISLASRAFAADASLETMGFLFRFYKNYSVNAAVPSAEKADFQAKACKIADQMFAKNPKYRYSIRARVECLRDQSDGAIARQDIKVSEKKLNAAHDLVQNSLKLEPNDQGFLILMTAIENDMASLWSRRAGGSAENQNAHKLSAKSYFVRALTNRARLQNGPGEVKTLYQAFRSVTFSKREEEIDFYRDIANAIGKSVQQFPEVQSFAYVLADASGHIGQLLAKDNPPRVNDAEHYLSEAIESFNKSGVIEDLRNFSEDFSAYCEVYQERAKLYATTDRPDLMLADIKKMKEACSPALDKYPFDIYLRFHFLDSAEFAGKVLFDLRRYEDAIPNLVYASHWGVGASSKLLASMYRDGLGVSPEDQKAKELDDLAKNQTMARFTVPADFSGVNAPFYVYVREWPAEYPFDGIDDQVKWLQEARGGTVAPEVIESFRKLQKIARDNKVSFPELCSYALDEINKDNTKEFEAARKKYALEPTVENLESLRKATAGLYDELVKQKHQPKTTVLLKSLAESTENLLKHSQSDAALSEAILAYLTVADGLFGSRDLARGRQNLVRAQELARKLSTDRSDGAYGRYLSFERIADSLLKSGTPADARAAYAKAASSLELYIVAFRTASPSDKANADNNELFQNYGSLAWLDVLAGNFAKSIEAAQTGLKIKPDAAYIEANLAHGLLLTGNPQEAIKHYMNVRKGKVGQRSLLDATAEDFGILKSLGFGDPRMDSILKQMGQE